MFRISKFRVEGLGFRVYGGGFRFQGLGLRGQDLGLWVQGSYDPLIAIFQAYNWDRHTA